MKKSASKALLWTHFVAGLVVTNFAITEAGHAAGVQVSTQHNDSQRTGTNLEETILTPARVASKDFTQLGSYVVDGQVFAQPLYISGVNVPGQGPRNVLYVATANNSVYAFDADKPNSAPIWFLNTGPAVSGARLYRPPQPPYPLIGIIGTPVIDVPHSTMYFVDMTEPTLFHTLYAVDIRTGNVRRSIRITGQIEGGGTFNPAKQNQRAALALIKDKIYIAWASFDDIDPFDGLVMSYAIVDSPTPLKKLHQFQVARFNPTVGARHKRGGIWHSGGGPAGDERGEFLYVVTGNGECNGHPGLDFDQSDVKLDLNLRVVDYFTPSFQNFLNGCDDSPFNDLDLSVAGPVLPPEWLNTQGKPVRRLLHGSKQGILYNVNRDNMGHFHEHENPIQQVSVFDEPNPGQHMEKNHIHASPVFWTTGTDRRVYVASDWGLGIKAFRINEDGMLDTRPILSSGTTEQLAFTQMSLSAAGRTNGILWTIGCVGCIMHNPPDTHSRGKHGVLVAYDAEDLSKPIHTSPIGTYPRFNAPTIANGRVYVPTFSGQIAVFGLASSVPRFAAIWVKPPGPAFVAHHGLTSQQYQQEFNRLVSQGFCLTDVSGYEFVGEPRFAAIWEEKSCPPFVARHGLTSQEYQQQFDELVGRQGLRLKLLNGYTVNGQDRYSAIWEKTPGPAFVARHGLTSQEYQQELDQLVGQGFCLTLVSGYAVGNEDRYAAIWEKKDCAPFVARHGLASQEYQQEFDNLVLQGFHLVLVNGHKINGQDSYAAIFEKSPSPAFVARHGLTSEAYQQEFDRLVKQGFGLIWVSGY